MAKLCGTTDQLWSVHLKRIVCFLDEVDLYIFNKILCLQSILEGKGVFLKKIGKFVQPSLGFNVIATANTKGKGSEDGRISLELTF